MKQAIRKAVTLAVAAAMACLVTPARAEGSNDEKLGVSCADCPNYVGAFSIENTTGAVVNYQYRWGNQHPWKRMSLASGRIETHKYPLGEDPNRKVPTPYVRFDRIGGDSAVTMQEYRMKFHAVGYAGYGPSKSVTEPERYVFRYAANGHDLDLKTK
jgi:hypothetical protein